MRSETGRTYKSEGIVLKRNNFGEADKVVTILSKHYGKISLVAKGIRRLSSKKRGNLEIFNQVVFFAVKGKQMDIVTETEILDCYSGWRKDLEKIAIAYEICEMVDKMTVEENDQEDIYFLLSGYLNKLNGIALDNRDLYVSSFGINLVKLLGYLPTDQKVPEGFCITSFIEKIIERELKSKKFLRKI